MTERDLVTIVEAGDLGSNYEHLMIELGLSLPDIHHIQEECPKDMRQAALKLLTLWKNNNQTHCNLQTLLNSMRFIEIDLKNTIQKLLSLQREKV